MIHAIQTRYAGYLFRSRLEARWAVFFDALKLNWSYEPEGFALPSGAYYLPDFRVMIRGFPVWFEVKPSDGDSPLFTEFVTAAPEEWRGAILNDIPDPRRVQSTHGRSYYDDDRPYCLWGQGGWDNYFRFCICDECREVGFEFDGRAARIGCGCDIHRNTDKGYTPDHPAIISAFAKARAARFEHESHEVYS